MTTELQELFAFVTVENGQEVVVAMRDGAHWQPLITWDPGQVENLRTIAKRIAHDDHREIKLVQFTARKELPL